MITSISPGMVGSSAIVMSGERLAGILTERDGPEGRAADARLYKPASTH